MFKKINFWIEEKRGHVTRVKAFKPPVEEGGKRGRSARRERASRKDEHEKQSGNDPASRNERPPSRWRRRSRAPERSGRRQEDFAENKSIGAEKPASPMHQLQVSGSAEAGGKKSLESRLRKDTTGVDDNHSNTDGDDSKRVSHEGSSAGSRQPRVEHVADGDDHERIASEDDSQRSRQPKVIVEDYEGEDDAEFVVEDDAQPVCIRRPRIRIEDIDFNSDGTKWATRVFTPPPESPGSKDEDDNGTSDKGDKKTTSGKKNEQSDKAEVVFPKKHGAFCRAKTRLGFKKSRCGHCAEEIDPRTVEFLKTEPDDESTPITEEEYQRSLVDISTCVGDPYSSPYFIATEDPIPQIVPRYIDLDTVRGLPRAPVVQSAPAVPGTPEAPPAPVALVPVPPPGRPRSRCHRVLRAFKRKNRRRERDDRPREVDAVEVHDLEGEAGGSASSVLILDEFWVRSASSCFPFIHISLSFTFPFHSHFTFMVSRHAHISALFTFTVPLVIVQNSVHWYSSTFLGSGRAETN